jgi:hypothetical protein
MAGGKESSDVGFVHEDITVRGSSSSPKSMSKFVTYPRKSLPLIRDVVPRSSSSYSSSKSSSSHRVDDVVVGRVRATPPGHMLNGNAIASSSSSSSISSSHSHFHSSPPPAAANDDVARWHAVRSASKKYGTYAREGFDHAFGANEVRNVDGMPLGGYVPEIDGVRPRGIGGGTRDDATSAKKNARASVIATMSERLEPEEEDALRAELACRRMALSNMESTGLLDDIDANTHRVRVESTTNMSSSSSYADAAAGGGEVVGAAATVVDDGREYGASRTTLDAPIGSLREKWRVLPHFLKLRGLMRQHIDSFDHFVSVEMRQIVQVSLFCATSFPPPLPPHSFENG